MIKANGKTPNNCINYQRYYLLKIDLPLKCATQEKFNSSTDAGNKIIFFYLLCDSNLKGWK